MKMRAVLALVATPLLAGPPGVAARAPAPTGAELPPGPVTVLTHDCHGGMIAVVDREGTATAVWATDSRRGPIMAARRAAGEPWGGPVRIGVGTGPMAVVDAAGTVTVVFETNRRNVTSGLSAVRRAPGHPWSQPVHLTMDRPAARYDADGGEGPYGAHRTDLTVNAAGDVIAVWQWGSFDRNKPFRVEAARRPAGGRWVSPTPLTRRNWSDNPVVGVDAAGRATVVYEHARDLMSRRFAPGSGWASAVRIRSADPVVGKDLVMTPDGTTVLAMDDYLGSDHARAAVVERPPTGPWGETLVLSPAASHVSQVTVAVDGNGTPVVGWELYTGRMSVVRRPAGHWSAPISITGPARNEGQQLAVNAAGDLAVTWTNEALGTRARLRDRTGHWTSAFTTWPTHGYYETDLTAIYPDGDLLGLVVDDTVLRARRVPVP